MRGRTRYFLPLLVAAVALLLTYLGWFFTSSSVDLYNSARFNKLSNDIENDITLRIHTYMNALVQTQGMVAVAPYMSRRLFNEYFSYISFEDQYPGLQSMGIVEKLAPGNLRSHVTQAKSEGFDHYSVHPPGKRSVYFPVINIGPLNDSNQKLLGLDLYATEANQKAMDESRDINRPVMTGKVMLDGKTGFVIFVPIYRNKSPISTLEQKQKNLVGYLYSSFDSDRFFASIFASVKDSFPIHFEIFLGEENEDNLIYDHDGIHSFLDKEHRPRYQKKRKVVLGQKTMTIVTYSLPIFDLKAYLHIPYIVLGSGILVAIFLAWLVHNRARQADRESLLYHRAQEAVASRDEFISIASHELKTPLATLKLQVQSLSRALERGNTAALTEEKLQRMSAILNKQVGRLTDLVENLLDVSRAGAKKLILKKEMINVALVVREVVERYQQRSDSSGSHIAFESQNECMGLADRLRIEQITENLVSNALKYAPGKPVLVKAYERDEKFVLEVSDQGPGISPENQSKIFERFERVNNTSKTVSGLGLGLYITKQIVEAHGGSISLSSTLGVGSMFRVSVPLVRNSDEISQVGVRDRGHVLRT